MIEFSYSTYEASDDNLDARTEVAPIKFILYKNGDNVSPRLKSFVLLARYISVPV